MMAQQSPEEYRIDVLHGVIELQRRRIQELEEKAAKVLAYLGPCDHYEVAILREAVERKAIDLAAEEPPGDNPGES
jgi:Icc-related predicted phosphoesterase